MGTFIILVADIISFLKGINMQSLRILGKLYQFFVFLNQHTIFKAPSLKITPHILFLFRGHYRLVYPSTDNSNLVTVVAILKNIAKFENRVHNIWAYQRKTFQLSAMITGFY